MGGIKQRVLYSKDDGSFAYVVIDSDDLKRINNLIALLRALGLDAGKVDVNLVSALIRSGRFNIPTTHTFQV